MSVDHLQAYLDSKFNELAWKLLIPAWKPLVQKKRANQKQAKYLQQVLLAVKLARVDVKYDKITAEQHLEDAENSLFQTHQATLPLEDGGEGGGGK